MLLSPVFGACWQRRPGVTVQAQHSSSRSQAPPFRALIPGDQRVADFRFWHDEKRFRGSGDESLAQHALLAAGGIRMGGNPKAAPVQGPMGWQVTDSWDILWSTSDGAHKAAPLIKPQAGQLTNALPGLEALTRKRNLALTLQATYGNAAWLFVPRSYSLPSQLVQWRERLALEAAHLATGAAAGAPAGNPAAAATAEDEASSSGDSSIGPVSGWWVLKTGQHLGQGLQVTPSSRALSVMLERNAPHIKQAAAAAAAAAVAGGQAAAAAAAGGQADPQHRQWQQSQGQMPKGSSGSRSATAAGDVDGSSESSNGQPAAGSSSAGSRDAAADGSTDISNAPRPFISVQQYITQPLLINSRKFGLRVWVLVVGPKPYRAFVYRQGLVLFSGQEYNPDLSEVQTRGAATQGHLTNAAFWGPEQHSSSSSDGDSSTTSSKSSGRVAAGDSSSAGGGATSDPSQQPVWTLHQLFDVIGQQQADSVWQQICETAGKVVCAAAGPVADAAKQLGWDGDAAFELLGFDFLLDSSFKPWLLEVNASPSMAWNTPGQPNVTQLMYSTKMQMLSDMFVLLRLHDRYPSAVTAAEAVGTDRRQEEASGVTARGSAGPAAATAAGVRRAPADAGSNPVLLQAASQAYFSSRPQVAEMVAAAAAQMAAAVAAVPPRHVVAAAVQQVLEALEQQQVQQANSEVSASDQLSNVLLQPQQHQQHQQQGQGQLMQQMQEDPLLVLLHKHHQQLVQVECELSSSGGWQSLLPNMPTQQQALDQGWQLHFDRADGAVATWLQLRQEAA